MMPRHITQDLRSALHILQRRCRKQHERDPILLHHFRKPVMQPVQTDHQIRLLGNHRLRIDLKRVSHRLLPRRIGRRLVPPAVRPGDEVSPHRMHDIQKRRRENNDPLRLLCKHHFSSHSIRHAIESLCVSSRRLRKSAARSDR